MQEILENEIGLLQEIYFKEFKCEKVDANWIITMIARPSVCEIDAVSLVSLTLSVECTSKYPDEVPVINISQIRGIQETEISNLLLKLCALTLEKKGEAMLYDLIECARSITLHNVPHSPCSICLDNFESEEDVYRTPGFHYFHQFCIADYMRHLYKQHKVALNEIVVNNPHTLESDRPKLEVYCPVCREALPYDATLVDSCADLKTPASYSQVVPCIPDEWRAKRRQLADLKARQEERAKAADLPPQPQEEEPAVPVDPDNTRLESDRSTNQDPGRHSQSNSDSRPRRHGDSQGHRNHAFQQSGHCYGGYQGDSRRRWNQDRRPNSSNIPGRKGASNEDNYIRNVKHHQFGGVGASDDTYNSDTAVTFYHDANSDRDKERPFHPRNQQRYRGPRQNDREGNSPSGKVSTNANYASDKACNQYSNSDREQKQPFHPRNQQRNYRDPRQSDRDGNAPSEKVKTNTNYDSDKALTSGHSTNSYRDKEFPYNPRNRQRNFRGPRQNDREANAPPERISTDANYDSDKSLPCNHTVNSDRDKERPLHRTIQQHNFQGPCQSDREGNAPPTNANYDSDKALICDQSANSDRDKERPFHPRNQQRNRGHRQNDREGNAPSERVATNANYDRDKALTCNQTVNAERGKERPFHPRSNFRETHLNSQENSTQPERIPSGASKAELQVKPQNCPASCDSRYTDGREKVPGKEQSRAFRHRGGGHSNSRGMKGGRSNNRRDLVRD